MIHLRRYFGWAKQESLPLIKICLRSAMRTMAAAVSAQYRAFSEMLYAETRRLLETYNQAQATEPLRLMSNDKILLEEIQAWLLLAHYESLCKDERQAMLTAGRAFRLVQIARLYDIDALSGVSSDTAKAEPDETFVEAEERRRTFWLTFCFDRFLCSRNEWPLTLQEEMVSVPSTYTRCTNLALNGCLLGRFAHGSRHPRATSKTASIFALAFSPKP